MVLVTVLLLISLAKCTVVAVWTSWHMRDASLASDGGKHSYLIHGFLLLLGIIRSTERTGGLQRTWYKRSW